MNNTMASLYQLFFEVVYLDFAHQNFDHCSFWGSISIFLCLLFFFQKLLHWSYFFWPVWRCIFACTEPRKQSFSYIQFGGPWLTINIMHKVTITTAFSLPAHWDWTTNHSISYFRNKKSIQRSFLYSFLDCRLLKNIWRTCTRGNIACNFCIHSFTHEITWTFPKDI